MASKIPTGVFADGILMIVIRMFNKDFIRHSATEFMDDVLTFICGRLTLASCKSARCTGLRWITQMDAEIAASEILPQNLLKFAAAEGRRAASLAVHGNLQVTKIETRIPKQTVRPVKKIIRKRLINGDDQVFEPMMKKLRATITKSHQPTVPDFTNGILRLVKEIGDGLLVINRSGNEALNEYLVHMCNELAKSSVSSSDGSVLNMHSVRQAVSSTFDGRIKELLSKVYEKTSKKDWLAGIGGTSDPTRPSGDEKTGVGGWEVVYDEQKIAPSGMLCGCMSSGPRTPKQMRPPDQNVK